MAETWRSNYVTEEDINEFYISEIVTKLTPILQGVTGKTTPQDSFLLESTIYKVLIYINNDNLPKPLESTVVEMSARQLAEYEQGLSSEKEGAVKRIQRGGFTQDIDPTASTKAIPRGTQFMQDYVKYLNRFRRVRLV